MECQNQHHSCYLRSFYVQVSVSTVITNITIGKSDKRVKQFTPLPQWTYCAIPGDIGVRISEEGGEAIVLCTSCVFQKGNPTITSWGNRVSASWLGRARLTTTTCATLDGTLSRTSLFKHRPQKTNDEYSVLRFFT